MNGPLASSKWPLAVLAVAHYETFLVTICTLFTCSLDASCSTIGFGELIPEKSLSSDETESRKRIILIVIFIIGGMSLISMSFNISMASLHFG